MSDRERLLKQFDAFTIEKFQQFALILFKYQSKYNLVYKKFINSLKVDIEAVNDLRKIPFMPIDFFKRHEIIKINCVIQFIDFIVFEISIHRNDKSIHPTEIN